MSKTKCHYCSNEATVCCEERIFGDEKLKTCPRAVCNRHATFVDGMWKCLGHVLPPDTKKPWES